MPLSPSDADQFKQERIPVEAALVEALAFQLDRHRAGEGEVGRIVGVEGHIGGAGRRGALRGLCQRLMACSVREIELYALLDYSLGVSTNGSAMAWS